MPPPLLDYLVTHEPLFRPSRLPSLYSDLTVQKTSNPEGYAANITAWTAALSRLLISGHLGSRLVLHADDSLLDNLASGKYGRPSLGCVLDEGVRSGKFIEEKTFLSQERGIYERGWGAWEVVRWGLRQVGVEINRSFEAGGGRVRRGEVVVVEGLEEVERRLRKRRDLRGEGVTDRVLSRDAFAETVAGLFAHDGEETVEEKGSPTLPLSEQDLKVLLRYLSRDKHLLSYDDTTIKFSPSSTSSPPEPITQQDRTIASLKTLITTLSRQTSSLSTKISTLQLQATTSLKNHNKPSALSALRSKKLAEKTLQQRLATLSQLTEIFTKIEDAVSQVEILAVMESSATTLKSLNKKIGGVERVEDVLESLREEVSKVDEVSTVLAEPGAVDQKTLLDEDEVDEELERMEREEKEKEEKVREELLADKLKEVDELERKRREVEVLRGRENEGRKETETETSRSQVENQQQQQDKGKEEDFEKVLSSSIENIRKLDIDDLRRENSAGKGGGEAQSQSQQQNQPVAEVTS